MYLADSLRLVESGVEAGFLADSPSLLYARKRAMDVVKRADIYSFTSSAMEMASDLVVDTPDRLERVAGAVFDKPRHVFVEAGYRERMDAFRGMRGFPFVQQDEQRFNPGRIGLDVDCFGDGKARIGVIWNFPKTEAKRSVKAMRFRPGTRLGREAFIQVMSLGIGFCFLDVDLKRQAPVARADFESGEVAFSSDAGVFFKHAKEQLTRQEGRVPDAPLSRREKNAVSVEAWRLYRLNQMATARLDPDAHESCKEIASISGRSLDRIVEDARRDLDGEIIYVLAFLAALDAAGDGLVHEPREGRAPRRARPVAPGDIEVDRLSVVSFDMSGKAGSRSPVSGGGSGIAGSRSRHFVRGHLFLARNNIMTYRRPHWRGGTMRKILHRVR